MQSRKAENVLYVTVAFNNEQVKNVHCRVYPPLKVSDQITFHLHPTREQSRMLRGAFEFSVRGQIRDYTGKVQTKIQAAQVYSKGMRSTPHSSPRLDEITLTAEPLSLQITNILSGHEPLNKTYLSFRLTPSRLLSPGQIIGRSYTGRVTVESRWHVKMTLASGQRVTFKNYFRYYENEEGDDVSFSELVAECTVPGERHGDAKIDSVLEDLNDVLLLTSFAERKRCACVGWDAADSKSHRTTYLHRGRRLSDANERGDELVDVGQFRAYIKKAYKRFTHFQHKHNLERVLHYLIPDESETLESSYSTLYAALEMLLSPFRKKESGKKSQKRDEALAALRKELEGWLAAHPQFGTDEEVKQLVGIKLSQLNSLTLSQALQNFSSRYPVELSDLWPLFGGGKNISLSNIRNKLLHGGVFEPNQYGALIGAREHLRWTVERLVLAVLGCDISLSTVSPERLRHNAIYKEMHADRKALSS